MLLYEEIKEINRERFISSFGLRYEKFMVLPKDLQQAVINSLLCSKQLKDKSKTLNKKLIFKKK